MSNRWSGAPPSFDTPQGQMILRQPLRHRRGHQEHLVPIDLTNVDSHIPSSPANQNAGGIVKIHATASDQRFCTARDSSAEVRVISIWITMGPMAPTPRSDSGHA
jgi:hypothetical protein